MDPFSRIIVGYHGCTERFARRLLTKKQPIREWQPSANEWDWLGHGIYFWEHAPARALRSAQERYRTRRERPAVLGAYIHLGRCFDLLDESITALLAESYQRLAQSLAAKGLPLPRNRGRDWKRRDLDCAVINACIAHLKRFGGEYDTVRGAFLEGAPVFPVPDSHTRATSRLPCAIGIASWVSFSLIYNHVDPRSHLRRTSRGSAEIYRKHPPLEGDELFVWLVREGIINAQGQVTRLIGGSAEPAPDYQNWTQEKQDVVDAAYAAESHNGRKNKSSPRKSRSRKSPG